MAWESYRYTGEGNRKVDFTGKALTIQGLPVPELVSVHPAVCPSLPWEMGHSDTLTGGTGEGDRVVIDCEGEGPAFDLRQTYEIRVKQRCSTGVGQRRRWGVGGVEVDDERWLGGEGDPDVEEGLAGTCAVLRSKLDSLTFQNCSSSRGGALRIRKAVTVRNCIFVHNSAIFSGGAAVVQESVGERGQVPGDKSETFDVVFQGCMFANNSAQQGGGVSVQGARAIFNRCCWFNNSATNGAALYLGGGEARISLSSIARNHAHKIGSAAYVSAGQLDVFRSHIQKNSAGVFAPVFHVAKGANADNLQVQECVMEENTSPAHPVSVHERLEHTQRKA